MVLHVTPAREEAKVLTDTDPVHVRSHESGGGDGCVEGGVREGG